MLQIVSLVIHFSANNHATRQEEGEIIHTILPSFPSLACKLLTRLCPLPVKVLQGETEQGRAVSLREDRDRDGDSTDSALDGIGSAGSPDQGRV